MSAPIVYRSTDASAPVLSGTVGSLVALLAAVLVNGYGSKSAAGWTEPFTGTGGGVFKAAGGNGFYLTVNDNGPGAGTFKEARIVGSETVSAYSATFASSTGNFPTSAQQANGLFVRKAAALSSAAVAWTCIADDRTIYFFAQPDSAGTYIGFMFGDFFSLLTGDGYRTIIAAKTVENDATAANDNLSFLSSVVTSTWTGHYIPRAYTGSGSSINPHGVADQAGGSTAVGGSLLMGATGLVYPNPVDGGVYASRIRIFDNATTYRGWMRGFYSFENQISGLADGDVFVGAAGGDFSGRTFLVVKLNGNSGVYLVETSNTWDTSS